MTLCPLCNLGPSSKLIACRGAEDSELVIVGEAPAQEEIAEGRVFVGRSGQLLDWGLKLTGLDGWDPWITNAVKCYSRKNPTAKNTDACAPFYLYKEITAHPRTVVLAMGSHAQRAVGGYASGVSKRVGLVETVQIPRPDGAPVTALYTYHPAAILREPNLLEPWLFTLERAREILQGQDVGVKDPPQSVSVYDPEFALRVFAYLSQVGLVAVDTETTALEWDLGNLVGISLSGDGRVGYWIPWATLSSPAVLEACRSFLASPVPKVLHNAKFDLHWLRRWVGPVEGPIHDTMVMAHLANENYPKGLKEQGILRLGAPDWSAPVDAALKQKGVNNFGDIAPEILGEYAGLDAAYTYRLAERLWPLGVTDTAAYALVMGASKLLGEVEERGVLVDLGNLGAVKQRAQALTEQAEAAAREIAGIPDLNLNAPLQVAAVLHGDLSAGGFAIPVVTTTAGGQASTSEESLMATRTAAQARGELAAVAFVEHVLTYRKAAKVHSTYVGSGMGDLIRPDGAIRGSYRITGTVTGRLSSSDPNMQNVPEILRPCFVARPGYTIIDVDQSQVEVRVWAALSGDVRLREAIVQADEAQAVYLEETRRYREWAAKVRAAVGPASLQTTTEAGRALVAQAVGEWLEPPAPALDTHRMVAAMVFHKSPAEITSAERRYAKSVTFGAIFGQSVYALAAQLKITEQEAQAIQDAFFGAFPQGKQWLELQRAAVLQAPHEVYTPFGRVRRLRAAGLRAIRNRAFGSMIGEAMRQATNSPIQGSASDINIYNMIRTQEALLGAGLDSHLILTVHDSSGWETREEHVEQALPLILETMAAPVPFPPLDSVPLRVDAKVYRHWDGELDLEEVDAMMRFTEAA